MKALKFLKEQRRRHINMAETIKVAYFDDELDEAIKELEELQNRICDGCKYYVQINKSDSFVCSLWLDCSRKYKPKDRFEPKDKQ